MTGAEARSAEVRRVLRFVLWLNLGVLALKVVALISSHALSVAAETLNSSLDAANNVFALWIARLASQEPDEDHPYGHQKFETLGALVLVGFLSTTVFELVRHAVSSLASDFPTEARATPLAVGVMAASMSVGILVSLWESKRGRELGSHILVADAAHTASDVLSSGAVLIGLLCVQAGYPQADPWITLLVAALVARTGWRIIRETVPVLVDERAIDSRHIQRVAESIGDVSSAYRIRSRGREGEMFAELTIAVAADLDVKSAHAIADEVARRVGSELGAREVVVHVEPA
jgi:cation diffusion facilitator family transporter